MFLVLILAVWSWSFYDIRLEERKIKWVEGESRKWVRRWSMKNSMSHREAVWPGREDAQQWRKEEKDHSRSRRRYVICPRTIAYDRLSSFVVGRSSQSGGSAVEMALLDSSRSASVITNLASNLLPSHLPGIESQWPRRCQPGSQILKFPPWLRFPWPQKHSHAEENFATTLRTERGTSVTRIPLRLCATSIFDSEVEFRWSFLRTWIYT